MTLDAVRTYCLALPDASEDQPFGPDVLVFRVGGKLFALLSLTDAPSVLSLKCDPERAVELRDRFEAVEPGYHLNKRHWNSVTLDGSVPGADLREWIDHSYQLVRKSVGRKERPTAD